jgi:hypothetical protein
VDVRVVLDELVLDGVDPRGPSVARAVERALAESLPGRAPVSAQELAAEVVAALARDTSDVLHDVHGEGGS